MQPFCYRETTAMPTKLVHLVIHAHEMRGSLRRLLTETNRLP